MTVFDATQVFRQMLTAWSPRRGLRLGLDSGLSSFASQLCQLRTQARLVLGDRLLEPAPLVGVQRLGAGAELPAIQASQLESDLLDLGIAPGDVAVLALQKIPDLVQLTVAIDKSLLTQGELLFGMLPTGNPRRRFGRECL
jgi:hypothetical protein